MHAPQLPPSRVRAAERRRLPGPERGSVGAGARADPGFAEPDAYTVGAGGQAGHAALEEEVNLSTAGLCPGVPPAAWRAGLLSRAKSGGGGGGGEPGGGHGGQESTLQPRDLTQLLGLRRQTRAFHCGARCTLEARLSGSAGPGDPRRAPPRPSLSLPSPSSARARSQGLPGPLPQPRAPAAPGARGVSKSRLQVPLPPAPPHPAPRNRAPRNRVPTLAPSPLRNRVPTVAPLTPRAPTLGPPHPHNRPRPRAPLQSSASRPQGSGGSGGRAVPCTPALLARATPR